jgi:hypothetical protein
MSPEVEALLSKIGEQGDRVRQLKSSGADKVHLNHRSPTERYIITVRFPNDLYLKNLFCFVFFKEQVTAEVNVLLELKGKYKTLTGKDFKPPNSGGKKEKKDKGKNPQSKQEKKQEKKEELKPSQDERAVKKKTRFAFS